MGVVAKVNGMAERILEFAGKRATQKLTTGTIDPPLPTPKFAIGQPVAVPVEVAESKTARVVGMEWGPANLRCKAKGWMCLVAIEGVAGSWEAKEEELVEWQESSSK